MRSEKGFSFIEVMIGIAILGILSSAFMMAIMNGTMVSHQANVRTTAEKLAVSQMETIKSGSYLIAQAGQADYTAAVASPPTGYRIDTLDNASNPVTGHIYGIPWDIANNAKWTGTQPLDPGIQKVTIVVQSNAELNSHGVYKEIFTLTDFKVNR
jgi:prepilin-type N-terminal cleavage/methylation domain-containing protein